MGNCEICGEHGELVTVYNFDGSKTMRCFEHVLDPESYKGEREIK